MPELYHDMTIGCLKVKGNLFLAPVAGFTDAAFRHICLIQGASLCFSEMISGEGIVRGNRKTMDLLETTPIERFPAFQIFGSDPETLSSAVLSILPQRPAVIDLNCGCPVPKVVKTGAGSALMKSPEKIGHIVSALRHTLDNAGQSSIPVTVKIRSGWDDSSLAYLEAARSAEENGAAMITLHPRTRSQGYAGKADWSHIETLKKAMTIPVIGSGDLFSPADARSMLDSTGCDGVMFARGAVGNPFIFHRTRILLETGILPPPPAMDELIAVITEHLNLAAASRGEGTGCREMRKHLCAYTKGLRGGASIRKQVSTASTVEEYERILTSSLRNP